MKRRHGFGLIAAAAVAAFAGAQASAFQQDANRTAGNNRDRNEIVVTGCLAPASGSSSASGTAGTTGSTTSGSSAGRVMLTHATTSSGSSSGGSMTGTTGSTSTGSTTTGS